MKDTAYLDALLSLPGMYGPQVSPDGKWAAWTWFRTGPAADVFAVPTDGSTPPVRLTETADDTYLVGWTPDSTAVIVSQDKDGNERDQLIRINVAEPLTLHPLTEPEPNYFIRGGDLHPNGKWLIYAANFDVATGEETEPTWVYRHDLETGERVPIAKPEKGGYVWPELSPTGEHVIYPRRDLDPAGRQVWLVGIDGSDDHEILNFGDDVKALAVWMPDGKRILFAAETDTHRKLGIWTLADESIRWLVDDPTRDILAFAAPRNTNLIVIVESEGAVMRSALLDPDTGKETRITGVPGNLSLKAPAADGHWLGLYFSSKQPADLVRLSLDDPRPETFTGLAKVWERTDLTADDLTPAENFTWESVDGLEIQGWLYRPQGDAKGTIVTVHGGPTAHATDMIFNPIQYFARQGFNVLDPNYRGSTGFGMEFREAIKKDGWGGKEQDDIRTGIEALIAAGIAEPGKVGVTGTSYGGYSAWCGITRWPTDVLAASAPICGMTDLVVDYESTRPDLRPLSEEMMGGRPDQVPERYYKRSPINFVEQIEGQLLIVQGMRDPNVTPENVEVVSKALVDAGVEYQLLAFEDEGHGISKPKNQKKLYQELAAFFAQSFKA